MDRQGKRVSRKLIQPDPETSNNKSTRNPWSVKPWNVLEASHDWSDRMDNQWKNSINIIYAKVRAEFFLSHLET